MTDIDKLAREIAAKTHSVPQKEQILSGAYDRTPTVKAARLGILEGMKLQRERDAVIAESCDSMEGHGAWR